MLSHSRHLVRRSWTLLRYCEYGFRLIESVFREYLNSLKLAQSTTSTAVTVTPWGVIAQVVLHDASAAQVAVETEFERSSFSFKLYAQNAHSSLYRSSPETCHLPPPWRLLSLNQERLRSLGTSICLLELSSPSLSRTLPEHSTTPARKSLHSEQYSASISQFGCHFTHFSIQLHSVTIAAGTTTKCPASSSAAGAAGAATPTAGTASKAAS